LSTRNIVTVAAGSSATTFIMRFVNTDCSPTEPIMLANQYIA